MLKKTLEWILGIPWVFQTFRRWALGGFSFAPAYEVLDVSVGDIVLDVGCGMGDAMNYMYRRGFTAYHGFDVDPRAIEVFRQRYPQENVILQARRCSADDLAQIKPTKVILVGFLHHVDDVEAKTLLQLLAESPRLERIVTLDTVLLPKHWANNLLARLDRGRFVRTIEGYHSLIVGVGLAVPRSFWIETGWRFAKYYAMALEPSGAKK
jgi:SAM-dependent methyltransferase